jgi:hypothetical protein
MHPTPHRSTALVLLLTALPLAGCAGYQLGHSSLFRPDIRTVHVPVFESESFRRDLGERLTEAVIKEIEVRTPYKVVHTPDADSTLHGRIVSDSKRVTNRNRNNDARLINTQLVVEVRWVNRRGEMVMQPAGIPVPLPVLEDARQSSFVPEGGQSLVTAQQQAIQGLARDIVGQMEVWW